MKKIIVLAFLLIISFNNIIAQESDATWEETVFWINSKLNDEELFNKYSASINNNIIYAERTERIFASFDMSTTYKKINSSIDLREIERAYIYSSKLWLKFPFKVKERIENTDAASGNKSYDNKTNDIIILGFRDDEMERRVLKAFQHLVFLAKEIKTKEMAKEKF